MTGDQVVFANGIGKTYRAYARPWDRLRELVTGKAQYQGIDALDGVSFQLGPGESLGIIGENGAGKSTLLSILSGVTSPSRGELRVNGKIASLLELGMGFHPELTGRQNILLNAAMLGLSEQEAQQKVPEILAFSELGDFIDRPVKTYSTGMAMRLGFAIAVQVEPEVLIIDEALSVGDGYFQKKCMDRIRHFVESGRTLLFCSHAMYYISYFCQRALWLHHGRAEAYGPSEDVVRAYENYLATKTASDVETQTAVRGPARITGLRFADRPCGLDQKPFEPQQPWELEIEWRAESPELTMHLGVTINTVNHVQVCSFGSHQDAQPCFTGKRNYKASLVISELPFTKGEFSLYVYVLDEKGLHVYAQEFLPAAFSAASAIYKFGFMQVDHRWSTTSSPVVSEHGSTPNDVPVEVEGPEAIECRP